MIFYRTIWKNKQTNKTTTKKKPQKQQQQQQQMEFSAYSVHALTRLSCSVFKWIPKGMSTLIGIYDMKCYSIVYNPSQKISTGTMTY